MRFTLGHSYRITNGGTRAAALNEVRMEELYGNKIHYFLYLSHAGRMRHHDFGRIDSVDVY